MGIPGLLPLLASISDRVHISAYSGLRVGIDASAWLHRGGHQCATELALDLPTSRHLQFCIGRIRLLLQHNVRPVLVFDGGRLPEKRRTEEERSLRRRKEHSLGLTLHEAGQKTAAFKAFQKCVTISPVMAYQLKRMMGRMGTEMEGRVESIVAPYEADAELAFLSMSGYVSAVISEDSDLLVFGCHRVLYKMDSAGHGEEIRLRNLGANTALSFLHWSHSQFQQMCVLAGCDYLPSLPSLGIKKAHALIRATKQWDRAVKKLRLDGKIPVYDGYEADFQCALLCFNHQRVFCPITRRLRHLRDLQDGVRAAYENLDFLGPDMTDDVAAMVADGQLHPETLQSFTDDDMKGVTAVTEDGPLAALRSLSTDDERLSADVEVRAEGVQRVGVGRVALPRMRSRGVEAISALLVKNKIDGYFVSASEASRSGFVRPRSTRMEGEGGKEAGQQMQRAESDSVMETINAKPVQQNPNECRKMRDELSEEGDVHQSDMPADERRAGKEEKDLRKDEDDDLLERGVDEGEEEESHDRLLTHAYSLPLRPQHDLNHEQDQDRLLPSAQGGWRDFPLQPMSSSTFGSPLAHRPPSPAIPPPSPSLSPSPSPSPLLSPPPPPVSIPVFSKYFAGSSSVHHSSFVQPRGPQLPLDVLIDGDDDLQVDSSGSDKENVAMDNSDPPVLSQAEVDDIEEDDEPPFLPLTPFLTQSPPLLLAKKGHSERLSYPLSAPTLSSSAVPREVERRVSLPAVRVSGSVHVRDSVSAVFAKFEHGAGGAAGGATGRGGQQASTAEASGAAKPSHKRKRERREGRTQRTARPSQVKGKEREATEREKADVPERQKRGEESMEGGEDSGKPSPSSFPADPASLFDRFRHPSAASGRLSPIASHLPLPPLSSHARVVRGFRR